MQKILKKVLSVALAAFVVSLSTYTGVNDGEISARTLVPAQTETQMELSEEENSSESQLGQAIELLNKKTLIRPIYGQDENILELLQAELVEEGLTDISLSIASVDESSYASIDADGSLNYFYVDPSENVSMANLGLANIKTSFAVHEGDNTQTTNPLTVQLRWDEEKVEEYFENEVINNFDFTELILPNTDTEDVIENFNPPYYTEGMDFVITWTSDNNAVEIGNRSSEYQDGEFVLFYPVSVKQGSTSESVTLTANFEFNRGNSDINYERIYEIVVPGIDLSKIEAEMQNDLDLFFNEHALKYSSPNADVEFDVDNVLHDIQLPTTSSIRRDITDENGIVVSRGIKDLYLKYVTSGSGFSFYDVKNLGNPDGAGVTRNLYRANVILPKDGEKPVQTELTMTLQHKDYDLAVSKTITLTLNPTDYDALMTKVYRKAELMDLVKANFFDIINSNPSKIGSDQARQNTAADKIEYDLSTFQEVRFKNPEDPNDNTLEYIYNIADKVGDGVSLAELPNWEMQESWRLLKSSSPRYLAHETLRVSMPEYNEEVSIEAMLTVPSMEQYKDFFPAHNTSEDSKKLASLFDQAITQELVLLGEKGEAPVDNPEDNENNISVNLLVLGSDILESEVTVVDDYNTWLDTSSVVAKDSLIRDFVSATLGQSENIEADIVNGFINSIKVDGHEANITAVTNGSTSSWMWYVKPVNAEEFTLIESLLPQDDAAYLNPGDTILLFFQNDYKNLLDPNLVLNSEETPAPTTEATTAPTTEATTVPTTEATTAPTTEATIAPTTEATTAPTTEATTAPTTEATTVPTTEATTAPTTEATTVPTTEATTAPTTEATSAPTTEATSAPTSEATSETTIVPTTEATALPTSEATTAPTTASTTASTTEEVVVTTAAPEITSTVGTSSTSKEDGEIAQTGESSLYLVLPIALVSLAVFLTIHRRRRVD